MENTNLEKAAVLIKTVRMAGCIQKTPGGMDLDYEMFCYQCEQTANGKGCTKMGVCGKTPEIAGLQDLLIYQIKGISCYGKVVLDHGEHMNKEIVRFIENVLFTTLTNVNCGGSWENGWRKWTTLRHRRITSFRRIKRRC